MRRYPGSSRAQQRTVHSMTGKGPGSFGVSDAMAGDA